MLTKICWIQIMWVSVAIVGVNFGFGGEEGESNQSGDDDVVILDGGLGVLGFEGVDVWDFGDVDSGDIVAVWYVPEGRIVSNSTVYQVKELSRECVVLLEEHYLC